MREFKCPNCGRSDLEMHPGSLETFESLPGGLGELQKPGEVHCRRCGWIGTPAELKQSY